MGLQWGGGGCNIDRRHRRGMNELDSERAGSGTGGYVVTVALSLPILDFSALL